MSKEAQTIYEEESKYNKSGVAEGIRLRKQVKKCDTFCPFEKVQHSAFIAVEGGLLEVVSEGYFLFLVVCRLSDGSRMKMSIISYMSRGNG